MAWLAAAGENSVLTAPPLAHVDMRLAGTRLKSGVSLLSLVALCACGSVNPSPPGWWAGHCAPRPGVQGVRPAADGLALPLAEEPWEAIVTVLTHSGATYVEVQVDPGRDSRDPFPLAGIYRVRLTDRPECAASLEAFLRRAYPSSTASVATQRREAFLETAGRCLAAVRIGGLAPPGASPARPPFTAPYWLATRERRENVGRFNEGYLDETMVSRRTGEVVLFRTVHAYAVIPPGGYGSGVACGGGWLADDRLFSAPSQSLKVGPGRANSGPAWAP
ncbi:MAG: hypothetical protein JWQ46_2838 [Phenylobacterium sp.]|nr:hypothetical protein [Phenylobacterium sp.]